MAPSPQQVIRRERIESLIALAAPFLDLVLAAGERVSRAVGPEDEYYPIRSAGEAFELPGSGRRRERDGEPVGWPSE